MSKPSNKDFRGEDQWGKFMERLTLSRWGDGISNVYTSAHSLSLLWFKSFDFFHPSALPQLGAWQSLWSLTFCHPRLASSMPGLSGSFHTLRFVCYIMLLSMGSICLSSSSGVQKTQPRRELTWAKSNKSWREFGQISTLSFSSFNGLIQDSFSDQPVWRHSG